MPSGSLARVVLSGGPFDGETAGLVPLDHAAPVQVVWSGWSPAAGFEAWLYEWHGEVLIIAGYTDALIFRATGRRLSTDEIPPVVAESAEIWADGAALLMNLSP